MHPRLDELLALRDGEASQETAEHVASCATCQATVAECRTVQAELSTLPSLRPERSALPALLEAARLQRTRRIWVAVGWVAASLTLAFTLTTAVRGGIEAYREAKLARQAHSLIAESQRLEHELQSRSLQGRVVSGTTASVIADLEDRIALIDARLQTAPSRSSREVVELWQERVYLLSTLTDVQTTRSASVGL
jgi:hypothetical protein